MNVKNLNFQVCLVSWLLSVILTSPLWVSQSAITHCYIKMIEVTIKSSTTPHPFSGWQLPTTRQTRRPRLAQLMLIQLGPRFFIRNKIIGFCPKICGQAMINTMMPNCQVYFLSIISLFFWLPLAVLVMLYAVIARWSWLWRKKKPQGLIESFCLLYLAFSFSLLVC